MFFIQVKSVFTPQNESSSNSQSKFLNKKNKDAIKLHLGHNSSRAVCSCGNLSKKLRASVFGQIFTLRLKSVQKRETFTKEVNSFRLETFHSDAIFRFYTHFRKKRTSTSYHAM